MLVLTAAQLDEYDRVGAVTVDAGLTRAELARAEAAFDRLCAFNISQVTAGGGRAVFLGAEVHAPGLVGAPKGRRSKPTPLSTNRTKERPPAPSPRRCGQSYRGVAVLTHSTAYCRTIWYWYY